MKCLLATCINLLEGKRKVTSKIYATKYVLVKDLLGFQTNALQIPLCLIITFVLPLKGNVDDFFNIRMNSLIY